MGSHHQLWVILSPVLRGRSDAWIWPSGLHSSLTCVQFPLLFSNNIWALRGLEERLKAGSALQLLPLCLPASLQGRVQQQPQNMPVFCSRKRKINMRWARALPYSCPPAAETSSGLLCPHPTPSLPNCSNFRSLRPKIQLYVGLFSCLGTQK